MKLDEIGFWSEVKLEIIRKYAAAYSRILANQAGFQHFYVDAFTGAGMHISKESGEHISGSSVNALRIEPQFTHYYFIDLDQEKTGFLREHIGERNDVDIFEGDCNIILLEEVFPNIEYEKRKRALCLLDPYGLDLNWEIIYNAGQMNTIEIFLNFPILDMHRNVLWNKPDRVAESQLKRMNAFWGDDSWHEHAYDITQANIFGSPVPIKKHAKSIMKAFQKRLKNVAGFKYVPDPIPMRNEKRGLLYYLCFASQKPIAGQIVIEIFDQYRRQGWN